MALSFSMEECVLLEQVLTRFLATKGNEDIQKQVQALHAKVRDEVVTEESQMWDEGKVKEESPAL